MLDVTTLWVHTSNPWYVVAPAVALGWSLWNLITEQHQWETTSRLCQRHQWSCPSIAIRVVLAKTWETTLCWINHLSGSYTFDLQAYINWLPALNLLLLSRGFFHWEPLQIPTNGVRTPFVYALSSLVVLLGMTLTYLAGQPLRTMYCIVNYGASIINHDINHYG